MAQVQSPSQTIRIVLAVGESDGEEILRLLGGKEDLEVVGLAQDGFEAARMAARLLPDVVLLDEQLPEMDGLSAAVAISLAAPQVATVLLTEDDPAQLWRRAIRAGVKDILPKPLQPAELLEAIQVIQRARERRETREFRALMDPELVPRVIAITGAKGGVGKTTIAVNLGVSLARQHPGQTVLVDLYSQFGDVALMLNLHPDRTLADMAVFEDEIDQDLVEAHLTPHESGLKVLVGANTPTDLNPLGAKPLRAVLNSLKRAYRFVVLDVPPLLYQTTTYVLTHATSVALVANLFDLTTLNDTRKLYQLLVRDYVPGERVHLVLNRVARGNRLRIEEIESALGRPAEATIPNATGLAVNAINTGRPFVTSHPEAAVSRSIATLADTLIRIGPDGAAARERRLEPRARFVDPVLSRAS
jgi:pilus assembly protein CpaE